MLLQESIEHVSIKYTFNTYFVIHWSMWFIQECQVNVLMKNFILVVKKLFTQTVNKQTATNVHVCRYLPMTLKKCCLLSVNEFKTDYKLFFWCFFLAFDFCRFCVALEASTLPLGYWGGGPWRGIAPRTSHTLSQHSTTRLSRRRTLTGDWTHDLPHSKPALYH